MYNPKVSVIIPCYNEEKNIANAIESVLTQTFLDYELIISDNCSTDNTVQIAEKYTDPRIKIIKNKKNMGVIWSRNNAISGSRGKYIAVLDGDDTCEPSRLEKQVAYMESHPGCVLCGTFADVFDGKSTKIQGIQVDNLKKYLTKNNPFIHSSAMYLRMINGETVCYPDKRPFEDYALWIKLSKYGDFYIIPEVLVHRTDFNNLGTKDIWVGYSTKHAVYKKLIEYQLLAIKTTGYWIPGLIYLIPSIGKAFISTFWK